MLIHGWDCHGHAIPVFTPLAVPEETTWDSPELVTAIDAISLVYSTPDAVLCLETGFISATMYADPAITGMSAMTVLNYVAGAK